MNHLARRNEPFDFPTGYHAETRHHHAATLRKSFRQTIAQKIICQKDCVSSHFILHFVPFALFLQDVNTNIEI